ncbi:hypothetical protein WR25_19375 [Diploscapter pachys]|uniref:Uncharacterized protein n=1 Tax=Diploscapter pachys TaxID=2018661 RepID=A0A2A2KEN3_9BILA|nr:hypothetical protein WR25_19375 [Diploscapter pachys]
MQFKTNKRSMNIFDFVKNEKWKDNFRAASSAALLSDSLAAPPLRKSSSAADWSGVLNENNRKLTQGPDWASALLEHSHKKSSFSHFNHLFALQGHASLPPSNSSASLQIHNSHQTSHKPPQEAEGGLVMSVSGPVDRQQAPNMQAVAHLPAAAAPQNLASKLAAASTASQASQAQTSTSSHLDSMHSTEAAHTGPKNSFLGGVFQRGFFAKPVVRTEEENYRYLMALDR